MKAKTLFGDLRDLKPNISSLLHWIQIHTDINLRDILTITKHNDKDPDIDTGRYLQHNILCSLKLLFIKIVLFFYCDYECSGSYVKGTSIKV